MDKGKNNLPISFAFCDGDKEPIHCAGFLRDLAKWELEQAEIIEDMEGVKKKHDREPLDDVVAALIDRDILFNKTVSMCSTADFARGYNESMKRVREYIRNNEKEANGINER